MDKENIQNTSELKVSDIKNALDGSELSYDDQKKIKKQNLIAIIICVIIAFIIWLVIMNNTVEHIPTTLPEYGSAVATNLVE